MHVHTRIHVVIENNVCACVARDGVKKNKKTGPTSLRTQFPLVICYSTLDGLATRLRVNIIVEESVKHNAIIILL